MQIATSLTFWEVAAPGLPDIRMHAARRAGDPDPDHSRLNRHIVDSIDGILSMDAVSGMMLYGAHLMRSTAPLWGVFAPVARLAADMTEANAVTCHESGTAQAGKLRQHMAGERRSMSGLMRGILTAEMNDVAREAALRHRETARRRGEIADSAHNALETARKGFHQGIDMMGAPALAFLGLFGSGHAPAEKPIAAPPRRAPHLRLAAVGGQPVPAHS